MRLVQSLKTRNYLHTRDCKGLIVWTWMWGPFALIDYRMGRPCGGAHEMSGIKAPPFSPWQVVRGFLGWVGVVAGGGDVGGWVDFGGVGGGAIGVGGEGWWMGGWGGGVVGSGWLVG